MAGLNLGAGAQVRTGAQVSYGTLSNPGSSMEAGFGLGSPESNKGVGALAPNDPAGITFWWGVLSTALLLLLYYSLPN